jgi:8-oxo-dGTP pyrophosphatase MutT (NUDIX family)
MSYLGAGFILLSSDLSSIILVHDARSAKWGFPKGHRESYDKTDLDTAIRECREETGLRADDYTVHHEVFKVSKGSQSYLFRYAVMKSDKNKANVVAGPSYEIADVRWVPIQQLLSAQNVLDGNKYLRTWIEDLKSDCSKKSVHIFKSLCGQISQEPVSSCNIITCA